MNYTIVINHATLDRTARAIKSYIEEHKSEMEKASSEVTGLSADWSGSDYTHFLNQWAKVTEKGSVSDKMITDMDRYADSITYAANQYRQAQEKTVNKANQLPKY